MIDPEIKSTVREHIVKANLALHRGEVEKLVQHLLDAMEVSKQIPKGCTDQ